METDHSMEDFREKQAELKEFKDMDREAVDYIGKEFRDSVSSETLEKMRGLPSEFKSHEELAKAYAKETGKTAPEGLEGFSKGLEMPAQLCSDHQQTINESILHERLHQASDPDGNARLGPHLSEGTTQALTEKMQAGLSYGNFYPEETRTAKEFMKESGDTAVEKLYFKNDAQELKDAITRDAQHDSHLEQFKKNYR
jgi:hypothetical protein